MSTCGREEEMNATYLFLSFSIFYPFACVMPFTDVCLCKLVGRGVVCFRVKGRVKVSVGEENNKTCICLWLILALESTHTHSEEGYCDAE